MNPFTKVNVLPDFGNNSCEITWEIDKEDYEGSEFFIRKSPDGERNIEIIQTSLDETARSFVDKKFYLKGRTDRMFYQVILRQDGIAFYSTFVEATGRKAHTTRETLDTDPLQHEDLDTGQQADGVLLTQERTQPEPIPDYNEDNTLKPEPVVQKLEPLNREFGIIQHINKLERLNMRYTGNACALVKPKNVGELSHEGIDQDTRQDINVFGENRFGQIYAGGFEDPICTYMLGVQHRTDITVAVQTGEGEVDKYAYTIRMLGQPRVAHDDIIVDLDSQTRYAVKKVDRYQFKGIQDVIQMVLAIAIDRSSVIYKFPVTCPEYDSDKVVEPKDPIDRFPLPPKSPPIDPNIFISGSGLSGK